MIVKDVEKRENGSLSFKVIVDKEEFDSYIGKVFQKNRNRFQVPGFRRGKAPRALIENMYGSGVFYDDAVSLLSPEAFEFAEKEEGLTTVGRPSVEDLDISDEGIVTLTFESAIYPTAEIGQYKELTAYRPPVEVTEEEIDANLEKKREQNARIESVTRPAELGDTVVIDYLGSIDGVPFEGGEAQGHSLKLGSGQFIPGFEEKLVGIAPGEEREITVTFPEEYHEHLAGKDAQFKINAIEVKETQLPELDDEFAKDVSEFDTLQEYRESVRKELEENKTKAADEAFRENLLKAAIRNMTVTIPDAMVSEYQEQLVREYANNLTMQGIDLEQYLGMMGMSQELFFASARPTALKNIQSELLYNGIVEIEKFEISEADLEEEYGKIAETYNIDIETVKKAVSEDAIKKDAATKRASELIYETGIATDVEPEPEEDLVQETEENQEEAASGTEEQDA